ncbi:MAG TPA: HD-GYP domain-containing protein [Candidatus Limnocylindrales bacterium]|nr:HD-GYP domain-containing protein [Candidatus Limnocylindrales bacterium]
MESATSLALLSAGLLGLVGVAAATRSTSHLAVSGALVAACAVLLAASLLVGSRLAIVGAAVAIATITAFSAATFELTPTVVWLFAFVVPVVGLVHGARLGALAGALSALALNWIETGVVIDPIDPQTPFGILILVALGAAPAYLLTLARHRRDALNVQLARAEGLVVETERARGAEAAARHQAIFMLARAAEARDGTTGIHIEHVRDLAAELARAAGIADREVLEIAWSAMLHDVGKLRVPDRVLLKPGKLDEAEWALIRQHPMWGEQLLMGDDGFALARRIARWHHENWDGSGYPDGLRSEAIPLAARIVRVVDVFDALRSERPYKPAWTLERSLEELRSMRGTGLEPALVDLFVEARDSQ